MTQSLAPTTLDYKLHLLLDVYQRRLDAFKRLIALEKTISCGLDQYALRLAMMALACKETDTLIEIKDLGGILFAFDRNMEHEGVAA
ncbi:MULTISPECIES: hypothetical protein [Giesbergeria]|uniref:Uncharacterized protein n=1 Tax=Giesbergeria sinuosa TaxID=80883 RepID=A0ABV9QCV9_9BURK